MSRDPVSELLDSSQDDNENFEIYTFVANNTMNDPDSFGLYAFKRSQDSETDVFSLLISCKGIGATKHHLIVDKELQIACDDRCCFVTQPESFIQEVDVFLPKVGTRARAWVVKSTRSATKKHENKHVEIWKHFGAVWEKFEEWEKGQSTCSGSGGEGRAKLIAHIASCKGKVRDFFNDETNSAHTSLDATEHYTVKNAWVPDSWFPGGKWYKQRKSSIYVIEGAWQVRLRPVVLDCENIACDR